MQLAKQLKDQSVCEHVLYMWNMEDTLRAYGLDADRLEREYVSRFPADQQAAELQWLENMVAMMREEGKRLTGHLQINQGTVMLLDDLHAQLLRSPKHPFYSAAYYKVLPFIVELRSKEQKAKEKSEVETCLEVLYGIMLLRLQKKDIGDETATAVKQIAHLLAMLDEAYKKDKEGTLEL